MNVFQDNLKGPLTAMAALVHGSRMVDRESVTLLGAISKLELLGSVDKL